MKNDATIVVAPTGSGKSVEIARLAADLTPGKVWILVPTRLVAEGLGARVAFLEKSTLGSKVGYRHGLSGRSSAESKIIYVTDGWMQTKELIQSTDPNDIVFGDEVHARTIALDLWRAYDKYKRHRGHTRPKTVYASATINSAALSAYHNDAPIIECEGRCFPIAMREAGQSVASDAVTLASKGKNVLVFLYGVPHIDQIQGEIEQLISGLQVPRTIDVLPLHSKLSSAEQQRALQRYSHPKIVLATNCAEVGITIEDIDAVVCSGLIRRSRRDAAGVTTLGIGSATQDEIKQQIGRAGRVKPGVAVVHVDEIEKLRPTDQAEIMHASLMPWILKLEAAGLPFRELVPFLQDAPPLAHITADYEALYKIGLVEPSGKITKLGERVAALPVHPRRGKMIVEALEARQLRGIDVVPLVIDMVSIMEAEGIVSGLSDEWRNHCSSGHASTPIAQLELFYNAPRKLWKGTIERVQGTLGRSLPSSVRSALKRLASEAPLEVLVESGDIARSAERETFERFSATLGSRARDEFLSLWGAIIQEYHRVRLQGLKNFGIGHTALSRALAVRNELRSRLKITGGYVSLQGNLSDAYRDEVQRHIWSANLDQMFYRCGRDDQGKIVYKPFGKRGTQAKKELTRMLSQDSVVKEAPFVCGEAINIGVLDDTGKQSYRRVIVMSTAIQRSWLVAKGTSLQAVQAQVRDALQRTPDHLPRRQKAPLDQKFFRPEAFQGSRNKTFGRR